MLIYLPNTHRVMVDSPSYRSISSLVDVNHHDTSMQKMLIKVRRSFLKWESVVKITFVETRKSFSCCSFLSGVYSVHGTNSSILLYPLILTSHTTFLCKYFTQSLHKYYSIAQWYDAKTTLPNNWFPRHFWHVNQLDYESLYQLSHVAVKLLFKNPLIVNNSEDW